MTPYIISDKNNTLRIGGTGDFSVFKTFDCGQCFRFDPVSLEGYKVAFSGVARGRRVTFAQNEPGELFIIGAAEEDFSLWKKYLALDTDYTAIGQSIKKDVTAPKDLDFITRAENASRGIRILRQDRWEALCSFIVSQNNNIPRIKKIIASMCETFGNDIGGAYDFPTPCALAKAGEEKIFALKTGFRAKYIADAAEKVSSGKVDLDAVAAFEKYEDAEAALLSVKGVGAKVAACTLLFGFERYDAFPVDVWIKRVLTDRFTKDFDSASFGEYRGIAQQYLFYYERYLGAENG